MTLKNTCAFHCSNPLLCLIKFLLAEVAFWIWYTIIASHYQYASLAPALDTPDIKHSAAERSLWSCQKAGWAFPRAAPKDGERGTWVLTGGTDSWCLGRLLKYPLPNWGAAFPVLASGERPFPTFVFRQSTGLSDICVGSSVHARL